MKSLAPFVVLVLGLLAGGRVAAAGPAGTGQKDQWANAHLLGPQAKMPFSFVYDGQPSDKLLLDWPKKAETKRLDANRTQHTITWTEPKTGLEVRCVAVEYSDYPAVEWTLYFRNTGKQSTPILQDIQGIDTTFQRTAEGEFVLHGNKGDWCTADSFQPFQETLAPKANKRFVSDGGRPTNHAFPYYNLQMPGGGVFLAFGWPGQWAGSFVRDDGPGLRVVAGQELTHLALQPGEEVRSPLIALLFWQGDDAVRAQNLWRRWMVAHNLPRTADGKLPPTQIVACSSHQFAEMTQANEENQKLFIDQYLKKGIKLDYWWMDAGWYPCDGKWEQTGTWEPDQTRFPSGLRAISDHAHAKGVKIITWFEPERVGDHNSWLGKNHPEWLLGNLLNLGNPDTLKWLIKHVDRTLGEQGIDFYRQDFNMDPLNDWRHNDAPDRRGMTENLYVQGYLAYWDALRQRHPQLRIDSCASGGRRNDLETMRRAVPLLRSDYIFEPVGQQGHSYGLASWLPYFGTGVHPTAFDAYNFRSCLCPSMTLCYDVRAENQDGFGGAAKFCEQARAVSPTMLGDYYPLTPYTLDQSAWMAWQYDRPDVGEGFVQAFRRDKCEEGTKFVRPSGLDRAAQYELTNFDIEGTTRVSGKDLMDNGLTIEIKAKPGAAIITYSRLK